MSQHSPRNRRWIVALLLPLLCAPVLAACGSASSSPPAAPASTKSPATQAATQAPSTPAEQDTAAGAKAAAQTIFELYGGGQYAAVWEDMAPGFRKAVPEATYVGVHNQCPTSGLSYQITDPVLAGSAAIVTVSLAGAASAPSLPSCREAPPSQ